jgi:hypothetical protein
MKESKEGDLLCMELDKDETFGYSFTKNGKFINFSEE